jgi:hypothetical protein
LVSNYKDVTILSAIWLGILYSSACESGARSIEAWTGGRSIDLFFVILTFMLINTNKTRSFLYIWGVFSILVTLKGRAADFGVDAAEQAWLDDGAAKPMFGKLRIFSFE